MSEVGQTAGTATGTVVEVDIGAVAHGGHCVARHDGRVVFVRHTLPGERVRALITEGEPGDRFWRADAIEVLTPSPERVAPRCPYSGPGRCGGCDWQHASLPVQRHLKAEVVTEQLRRLAGLDVEGQLGHPVQVEAVPGDVDGLDWRTRVQLSVDGAGRLGLRKHRSHDVVPIESCPIAHPAVDAVVSEATRADSQGWGGCSTVEVVASAGSDDPPLVLLTPSASGGGAAAGGAPRALPAQVSVARVGHGGSSERIRGRSWVREGVELDGAVREFRVSGSGFWQVHPGAAAALVEAVLSGLAPRAGERALDLYCGVGLFAAALAGPLGPQGAVIGVESDPRAVGDARRNLHDVPTVRLVQGRVERALGSLGLEAPGEGPDLVVLDPARTGAGRRVIERVTALRPRAVAYVACDPAALARDIAYARDGGYRLESLRAFDIFPMTHHVECVAVLVPAG